jgi:hypothetical protein
MKNRPLKRLSCLLSGLHVVATVSSAGITVPVRMFRNALKQILIRTLRTYALGLLHIRL